MRTPVLKDRYEAMRGDTYSHFDKEPVNGFRVDKCRATNKKRQSRVRRRQGPKLAQKSRLWAVLCLQRVGFFGVNTEFSDGLLHDRSLNLPLALQFVQSCQSDEARVHFEEVPQGG